MTDIRVLHTECVLCQTDRAAALPEGLTAAQSARVILGVAFDYGSLDALERDLCFVHRREMDERSKRVNAAREEVREFTACELLGNHTWSDIRIGGRQVCLRGSCKETR